MRPLVERAMAGEIEIVVSAYAEVEVVKLDDEISDDDERMIRDFFAQDFIIRADLDPLVAEIARQLVRRYPRVGGLTRVAPKDAVHLATALRWKVPIFETFDDRLIERISQNPGLLPGELTVRRPFSEGQQRLVAR